MARLSLASLLALFCFPVLSQTASPFSRVLKRLNKEQKVDSFLQLTEQHRLWCAQHDSLLLWLNCVYTAQDLPKISVEKRCSYAQNAIDNLWRKPTTRQEQTLAIEILSYNGYLYWREKSNLRKSFEAYEKAHRIMLEANSVSYDIAEYLYKPLTSHCIRLGDNEKAIFYSELGLKYAKSPKTKAGNYSNLGSAYWNKGDLKQAEKVIRQGIDLEDVPPLQKALLWGALAEVQLSKNKPEEAVSSCKKSLEFSSLINDRPNRRQEAQIDAQFSLGKAFLRMNELKKAQKSLLKAKQQAARFYIKNPNRKQAKICIALAQLYEQQGNLPESLSFCNEAVKVVLPSFKAENDLDLPDSKGFYAENSILEALTQKAKVAFLIFEKTQNEEYLHLAADCHALAWEAEMTLRNVYFYSSSKLWIQEQIRQRQTAALQVYRALFERTGDRRWAEQAFTIAEQSKGLLLLEAMQEKLLQQRTTDGRFSEIQYLLREIAETEGAIRNEGETIDRLQRLDSLRTAQTQLIRALQADYNQLPDAAWFATHLPRTRNFEGLHDDETLVAYFQADAFLHCFIFEKNKPIRWEMLPFEADKQQTLLSFLDFFKNRNAIAENPNGYLQKAHQLYQILLPQSVQNAQKLLIVPDGSLAFVPFDALTTAAAENLKTAPYFLKKTTIRYAYSYNTLLRQLHFEQDNPTFFVGFAPLFQGNERNLAPLAGAEKEWYSLSIFSKKENYVGGKANKKNLLQASEHTDILHLATHATAHGDLPRIECLDTCLWLNEIYALNLHAKLVVLSACETSLGEDSKGEGVLSLARAFTVAGAAATLSNLWEVSDAATTAQFSDFYRTLNQGQMPSEAMRKAKLEYLSSDVSPVYQTPYYWAAMTFVGVDKAIDAPFFMPWWKWVGIVVLLGFALAVWFFKQKK